MIINLSKVTKENLSDVLETKNHLSGETIAKINERIDFNQRMIAEIEAAIAALAWTPGGEAMLPILLAKLRYYQNQLKLCQILLNQVNNCIATHSRIINNYVFFDDKITATYVIE